MSRILFRIYARLFARPYFYKMNKALYFFSLRGLGVLNYQGELSGERNFLNQYLKNIESPLVIDVGANEGGYSDMVLGLSPNATIHAFEPHPATFKRLKKRTQNKNMHITNVAVGKHKGTVDLFDYDNADGSAHASIFESVISDCHSSAHNSITVPMIMLDDYLAEKKIENVALLKVDVEGNEMAVLLGGIESIRSGKIDAIHFEFNEMNSISKVFFRDFLELLADYSLYRLLPSGMIELNDYYAPLCEIFAYQNIVALKRSEKPKSKM